MFMNTRSEYGLIARLLHWLTFVLVIAMIVGGSVLSCLPDGGLRSFAIGVHKSTGGVIFLMVIGRLLWRNFNPKPCDLGTIPVLNYIAHVLHVCLYILLILQPLSGILMSQAYGYPVLLFGVFKLPPLVWQSMSLGNFFHEVHGAAAIVLTIAIAIHAAAALKHHFIDCDRTLMRMIKGR